MMDSSLLNSPHTKDTSTCNRIIDEDILCIIFMENAKSRRGQRLKTARNSSQVCQHWRRISLRYSALWGKLIDLRDLGHGTHDWTREVLSRAGNALLWITGPLDDWPHPTPDFIYSFIVQKWSNIQRLSILVEVNKRLPYWNSLFVRPAPNLEEFIFYLKVRDSEIVNPERLIPPSTLFNSTAPALKTFSIYRSTRCELAMDSLPLSWFSKLRSFCLRSDFRLKPLLETLKLLPLLENLKLYGSSIFSSTDFESVVVRLPRLVSLTLERWQFHDIGPFMKCIAPAPGCSLSILALHQRDWIHNIGLEVHQLHLIIMQYAQDYFEHHPPTKVSLTCLPGLLKVQDDSTFPPPLSIEGVLTRTDDCLVQNLFAAPFFSTVQELHHDCQRYSPHPLSGFASVKTLKLPSIHALINFVLDRLEPSTFPELRILKLGDVELRFGQEEPIRLFLSHRRDIGRPLSVLDLSLIHPSNITYDLSFLEEFTGLMVRWAVTGRRKGKRSSVQEYTCGSGRPEALSFNKRRKYVKPRISYFNRISRSHGWSGHI